MLVALDNTVTVDYSLKADTGEPRTIFVLGYYDSFIASRLQNLMYQASNEVKKKEEVDLTSVVFEFVRHGLKGIKNLQGLDFSTVELDIPKIGKRTVASDELLKNLKVEWVLELYTELLNINFLNEQEKKT